MDTEIRGAHAKSVAINLDPALYGTFAEIGAGQETARWFFRVGGAAGTVAKSMSAYDMKFSDSIYGTTERYVSRGRLRGMLDHEFHLLTERLDEARGAETKFFVFANTVAARSFRGDNQCHGWLGVRFQREPRGRQHEVILHVRMFDPENLQQQETLGIMGVNLLYACFHHATNLENFIDSLYHDLSPERIESDLLLFSGEDFGCFDNRIVNLRLVQKGYTRSIVIAPGGEVLQAADLFYGHHLLIERGNFRPVTRVNLEMLAAAREAFSDTLPSREAAVVEIMEISLRNPLDRSEMDSADFLARAELLGELGKTVMVSNYAEFHRLIAYLRECTRGDINIVVGIALLRAIFEEKYYADLAGGILESFGRFFKKNVRVHVYPALEADGSVASLDNFHPDAHLKHLLDYLRESSSLVGLKAKRPAPIGESSRDVLAMIRSANPAWEEMVVPEVAERIRERGYFGCMGSPAWR